MKRKNFIIFLIVVFTMVATPAYAKFINTEMNPGKHSHNCSVFFIGKNVFFVNDALAANIVDAKPFIDNGRSYLPVRYLGYALGIKWDDIKWDDKTKTVSLKLDNKVMELTLGSKVMKFNGQDKTMDVEPVLKEGRVYLPARWVAESFGFVVESEGSTLLFYWPGERPPVILGESGINFDVHKYREMQMQEQEQTEKRN